MNEQEYKNRTRNLALRVIRLVEAIPKTRTADVVGRQLLRCGTAVGANYRSACRARSTPDIIAKLGIVEEEADETLYWMELLIESGLVKPSRLTPIMKETDEILAMTVASIKTLRARQKVSSPAQIQSLQHPRSVAEGAKSKIGNPKFTGRSNHE